jgi:hypothetical protein
MERFKRLIAEKTKPATDWQRVQEILYSGKFVHYDGFVGVDTDWHYKAWMLRQKPKTQHTRCWYCNDETNSTSARPVCEHCTRLMRGKVLLPRIATIDIVSKHKGPPGITRLRKRRWNVVASAICHLGNAFDTIQMRNAFFSWFDQNSWFAPQAYPALNEANGSFCSYRVVSREFRRFLATMYVMGKAAGYLPMEICQS